MKDDPYTPRPLARWYMAGAIAAVVFMILGVATYLLHVPANPATLEPDQRAMFATAAIAPAMYQRASGLGV